MTPQPGAAVVTGAGSGIGRATAIQLAADGYRVALVDIDPTGLEATNAEIERSGGTAEPFQADVCDAKKLGFMVREVVALWGVPQILANVAGIGLAATVIETSDDDWARVIETNLTGPFLLTRAVLPLMLDRGSGVIINVASVAATVGIPARAAYCASKAGLVGLTRAIAADHAAAGIRCVAVCPGTVDTEWIGRMISGDPDPDAARARMARRQLDGQLGTPAEIAATIAFIASPRGRFFNGAAVVVDGGLTAV
jgi:NAD(P)-dependent dehydrogenase (short-subunit alcohol dehydrogenase family)